MCHKPGHTLSQEAQVHAIPVVIYSQQNETTELAVILSQAERCTAEMRTLTSELESAQPSLRSAAEAEDATAAACARCTPALIQESAALKQHLAQSLGAADCLKAGLPHLHMVAADLKLMLAQVIPGQADVFTINPGSPVPSKMALLWPVLQKGLYDPQRSAHDCVREH